MLNAGLKLTPQPVVYNPTQQYDLDEDYQGEDNTLEIEDEEKD